MHLKGQERFEEVVSIEEAAPSTSALLKRVHRSVSLIECPSNLLPQVVSSIERCKDDLKDVCSIKFESSMGSNSVLVEAATALAAQEIAKFISTQILKLSSDINFIFVS